ncbi:MAG: recombinase zinc beta ribbon domain-containing protein, partial [Pseudomonadota bacterium]
QTVNRMRARVVNGYWVFACPYGYKYERRSGQGNVLVRDEPLASIIQEALEGFASGRFQIQAEVKRFLESFPEYPRDKYGEVRMQRVKEMLTRPVYAGYVEAPSWNVSLRPGQHEAVISFENFQKIQDRLNEGAKAPARKNLSEDFPLRGAVVCGDCSTPLTACWSTGKTARYPYYLCRKKGCESYGKSIKRGKIEGEFEVLLQKLQPAKSLFQIAASMFRKLWDFRLESQKKRIKQLDAEAHKTQKQIDQLLDRVIEADSPSVIKAYENKISVLERHKAVLEEKAAETEVPANTFEDAFRTSMLFLANPYRLWRSGPIEAKRAVLKLAFASKLAYARNEGFRTPETALPIRALAVFAGGKAEWRTR